MMAGRVDDASSRSRRALFHESLAYRAAESNTPPNAVLYTVTIVIIPSQEDKGNGHHTHTHLNHQEHIEAIE